MEKLIVAALQMGMHLPLTRKEFRTDFERFLKVAAAKQCNLVAGSELGAAMIGLPFVDRRHREALLKVRRGQSAKAGLLTRIRGSAERLNPRFAATETPRLLQRALRQHREEIRDFYDEVFGGFAARYRVTLVAPSAYLADPVDDEIRHLAGVYDMSGERVGYQAKVILTQAESNLAAPGKLWKPVETSAGVLGVAIGFDGLLPEVGRLHATQRSSLLVHQVAASSPAHWHRARQSAAMRCVENQLFGCVSATIGPDNLSADPDLSYVGQSQLLAPPELSPEGDGVLVRTDRTDHEGLATSILDYRALQQTWQDTVPAFRQEFARIWHVYSESQARVSDMDRMLPAESLAEDMADEEVTIVETRTAPLIVSQPGETEPEPSGVEAAPAEQGEQETDALTADPEGKDDILSEGSTLDDLKVVSSQEFPWRAQRQSAPTSRNPVYQSRGSLDETQDLDSVKDADPAADRIGGA